MKPYLFDAYTNTYQFNENNGDSYQEYILLQKSLNLSLEEQEQLLQLYDPIEALNMIQEQHQYTHCSYDGVE